MGTPFFFLFFFINKSPFLFFIIKSMHKNNEAKKTVGLQSIYIYH